MDFLFNLAFKLKPKTFQKSIPELSKISEKHNSKNDASCLGFWSSLRADFGWILGPSWEASCSQVGTKI